MSTSKIKINPVTKEIEIEVSDEFLLKYFQSLGMMIGKSKTFKVSKSEKTVEKKAKKIDKKIKPLKKPRAKSGAIRGAVLDLIKKGKEEGVIKKDIIEETGLEDSQVSAAINTLKKEGIIRNIQTGVYEYVKPEIEIE